MRVAACCLLVACGGKDLTVEPTRSGVEAGDQRPPAKDEAGAGSGMGGSSVDAAASTAIEGADTSVAGAGSSGAFGSAGALDSGPAGTAGLGNNSMDAAGEISVEPDTVDGAADSVGDDDGEVPGSPSRWTDACSIDNDASHEQYTIPPSSLVPPAVASPITPPQGLRVVAGYSALGWTISTCEPIPSDAGDATTTFTWVPSAVADLYGSGCRIVAHLEVPAESFAGPSPTLKSTWTSVDGSSVTASQVSSVPSPGHPGGVNASPWVLYRATSHGGEGIFSDVTYVQRVDTYYIADNAPFPCDPTALPSFSPADGGADGPVLNPDGSVPPMTTVETLSHVYQASYYFYTGGTMNDGGL